MHQIIRTVVSTVMLASTADFGLAAELSVLAPKSFFSVVPFAQSSAYSISRWHSWRRLGGGGVAQGPYDVARGETLQDARKPMHTDPQSLVDVWSRRNLGLGIPPKWLIFLRSLGDSNPCFRRERANCIA